MQEIEVKILNIDRRRIEERLLSLGAEKVFDGHVENLFFDFKNRALAEAKNLIRLRKEDDKTVLTFKKFLGNEAAKTVEEYEVVVSDMENMKKILESLGLSVTENMHKHRVSYRLNHAHFDIDKYEREYGYIPEFLEIEAENTDTIRKCAKLLGFTIEDCLPWSTEDLVNYYKKKTSK